MPTFTIQSTGVTVVDDRGDTLCISPGAPGYKQACDAVMVSNWELFKDIAFEVELDSPDSPDSLVSFVSFDSPNTVELDSPDVDEFGSLHIPQLVATVTGLVQDELITPEDLGIKENTCRGHEHDLSQWSGSPIFYPTREMARAQSDRWGAFWDYHDFGKSAPVGYRYATVPRGVGPTAPPGYDWVCLPREED